MRRFKKFWSGWLIVLLLYGFALSGCDWSAMWDLKKAERALKRADKANAEFWCEKEYRKAQGLFEEAQDLARARRINEARDKALEAFEWAEEAEHWSKVKAEEMRKEQESIESKKY